MGRRYARDDDYENDDRPRGGAGPTLLPALLLAGAAAAAAGLLFGHFLSTFGLIYCPLCGMIAAFVLTLGIYVAFAGDRDVTATLIVALAVAGLAVVMAIVLPLVEKKRFEKELGTHSDGAVAARRG